MAAAVTWWIGSFIACFGARLFRRWVFPLCFLFVLVPVPQAVLDDIVRLLQLGSAYTAHLLFAIVGVPVSQNGIQLAIPGLTIEVAKECSSVRSSMMLVVTSMVLAHLLLQSIWGKLLTIATAIVLTIAKNGLRIFTISMLGVYIDPGFLNGRLHRQGGVLFFLLALLGMLVQLQLTRVAERRLSSQGVRATAVVGTPAPATRGLP